MKPMQLFILLFFFIYTTSFTQWVKQESGVTVRLDDVCFVDSLHGWAMSSGGTVLATTDGGDNWQIQLENKPTMKKIKFYDRNLGFILIYDDGSVVAKTENGGNNWEFFDVGVSYILSDIFISTKDSIWVIGSGNGGIILFSSDGGENWEKKYETVPADSTLLPDWITGITFYNSKIGWVITEIYHFDYYPPTSLYQTIDGGENWEFLSNTAGKFLGRDTAEVVTESIYVDPKGILWAWGTDGLIKSTDFGKSWIYTEQSAGGSIFDFCYADSNLIYTVNIGLNTGNGVYYSIDSGLSWNESFFSEVPTLRALSCIGKNKIWGVGNNGTILFNNNVTSNIPNESQNKFNFELSQNYPNPFNPSTMIKYGIPEQSNVKIEIFNMLGQSVGVLVNSNKSAGNYETNWNATNLPSGIYLISIKANGISSKKNFTQVKKAILLK